LCFIALRGISRFISLTERMFSRGSQDIFKSTEGAAVAFMNRVSSVNIIDIEDASPKIRPWQRRYFSIVWRAFLDFVFALALILAVGVYWEKFATVEHIVGNLLANGIGIVLIAVGFFRFLSVFGKPWMEHTGTEFARRLADTDPYRQPPYLPPNGVAGALIRSAFEQTEVLFSSPSSEEVTPDEHRPGGKTISFAVVFAPAAIYCVAVAIIFYTAPNTKDLYKPFGQSIPILVAFMVWLWARSQKKSADHLLKHDLRPAILYLRAFADDGASVDVAMSKQVGNNAIEWVAHLTFEEAISEELSHLGPFIALGSGKELLPRLGAARAYADNSAWQEKVLSWMEGAQLILFLIGEGNGLEWEMAQIGERNFLLKTFFLMPPRPRGLARLRWSKRNAGRWARFIRTIDGTCQQETLSKLAPEDVLGAWFSADGAINVVKSKKHFFQDYEVAIRLAVYKLWGTPIAVASR
jgi:hypothetical protein